MTKIIGIPGSLRQKSFNKMLLQAMQQLAPKGCEIEIAVINDIPLYNNDVEESSGIPPAVQKLKDKIINADALLIATPEYNHSIPGVAKNVLDWLTRPPQDTKRIFANLPVGLVGASPSRFGTVFSQTAWLQIFRYLNVKAYFGQQLFLANAHECFDEQGHIKNDETKKLVSDYINDFNEFIEKNR